MANQHYYSVSVRDYSEEISHTSFYFGAVTAVSIAGLLTQIGALRTAITNLITGVIAKDKWVGDDTIQSQSAPASPNAQNELKLQFSYEGTTNHKRYRAELPCADPSKVLPGTDKVDLTDSEVAAFVTAFEAMGRTPDSDEETVEVLDARLVGRNI